VGARLLFESTEREAAHRALEYVRGDRKPDGPDPDHPGTEALASLHAAHGEHAECRENHADEKPYQIWSSGERS
jgi:hypothetical protein